MSTDEKLDGDSFAVGLLVAAGMVVLCIASGSLGSCRRENVIAYECDKLGGFTTSNGGLGTTYDCRKREPE